MFICLKEVNISKIIVGNDSDMTEFDKRIQELFNAPLHMKQEKRTSPV
jgi:hypothetical protein